MPLVTRSTKPRKPRPALSQERISTAAFGIVDSEGAAALSARRLASTLGCEAMSLYHHVANMEAILDLVVDRLLGKLALPPAQSGTPRTRLIAFSQAFLGLAIEHPDVFVLATSRRWVTPAAFRLARNACLMFETAGASSKTALRCARILGAFLGGAGAALAGWTKVRHAPSAEQSGTLEAVAPGLLAESTADSVKKDLDHGLLVIIDTLLAQAAR